MLVQHLSTNRYEVLALQSLSVRPRQLPQLPGFHYPPFRVHDEKGGVRLATYVSLGLAAKQDSLPSSQPQEGYQLATTIQTQGQDIHILNCYNPTRTRDFSWLANIPNNWLVVGDFNTRDSLWEYEYPKSSAVIGEQLQDADVVLNDGSRTRLPDRADNSTSAIDLSFISANMAGLTEWTTLDSPLTSDHLPIEVTIFLKPIIHQPSAPEKFNLEKADWERFQLLLSEQCRLDLSKTVDQLHEEITREILKAARALIPLKRQGLGQWGSPWWNLACKLAVKRKRKAHHQYLLLKKRQATAQDIQVRHAAMKAANTACKKVVAEAKLQYWEAQAKDKPGDLGTMWQSLKILRRAYNPPDHDLTAADGRVLQSLEEKAQGFLQHFTSTSTTAELPMAQQQLDRGRGSHGPVTSQWPGRAPHPLRADKNTQGYSIHQIILWR